MFGLPALRHTPTLPPLAVVADRSERPFRVDCGPSCIERKSAAVGGERTFTNPVAKR
jgi:hypothetical protein